MRREKYVSCLIGALGGWLAGFGATGGVVYMWLAISFLWGISKNISAAFLWGLVAVLVSHSWLLALHPLSWIGVPGFLSLPIAISIWFICGVCSGLLVGFWSFVGNSFLLNGFRGKDVALKLLSALVLSCTWGLAEVLLAHYQLFWIGVGQSVLPNDMSLAGLAKWFGSGGLATVQLLIGFSMWNAALAIRRGLGAKKAIVFCLLFASLMHIIGARLLVVKPVSDVIPVALWQSDIPIRTKFSKDEQIRIPQSIQDSLHKAKDLSASWLVAPEGTLNANQELLEPAPVPFLTGGFRWVRGEQRRSLLYIDRGEKKSSNAIDKHRLVPLGEKVPSFPRCSNGLSAVGGLHPGDPSRLFNWSGPAVAVAICYELSDGHALAKAVRDGAEWILVLANLDPYPISLQRQFVSLAQLRSMETSRDLISVANTGPSALIKASGEIQQMVPPFVETTEVVKLQLEDRITGYTRWQELPLICIFIVGLFGVFFLRFWLY